MNKHTRYFYAKGYVVVPNLLKMLLYVSLLQIILFKLFFDFCSSCSSSNKLLESDSKEKNILIFFFTIAILSDAKPVKLDSILLDPGSIYKLSGWLTHTLQY